jgi:hypothetical protein
LEENHGHASISNKALHELHVKARNCLALGFAIALASGFGANAGQDARKAAGPHYYHYVHRRIPAVPEGDAARTDAPRVSGVPRPAPYLPVQNDSDGLSRDPEDCNKGCLDSVE